MYITEMLKMTSVKLDSDNCCCLFCYKTFPSPNRDETLHSRRMQSQFFRTLQRHLLEENINLGETNPLSTTSNETVKEVVVPCPDCLEVLKSYCEYYKEIKVLEMKLNWRLWALKNIINSSEEISFRRRLFQDKVAKNVTGGLNEIEFFQSVRNFRKELAQKSSQRINFNYPKVKVQKCTFLRQTRKGIIPRGTRKVKEGKDLNQRPSSVKRSKRKILLRQNLKNEVNKAPQKYVSSPVEDKQNKDYNCDGEDAETVNTGPGNVPEVIVTQDGIGSSPAETEIVNMEGSFIPPQKLLRINVIVKSRHASSSISIPEPDRSHVPETEDVENIDWEGNVFLKTENTDDSEEERSPENVRANTSVPYAFMRTTFTCQVEKCKTMFYNKADLENHSRLHGTFKCSFCPVTKSFAPHLSLHELTAHENRKKVVGSGEVELHSCVRCDYSVRRYRLICIEHHLSSHLNLSPDRHTCPVCSKSCRLGSDAIANGQSHFPLMRHFKKCHDVRQKDFKKLFRCDEEGCPAYFLKQGQLAYHTTSSHGGGDGADNMDWEGVDEIN